MNRTVARCALDATATAAMAVGGPRTLRNTTLSVVRPAAVLAAVTRTEIPLVVAQFTCAAFPLKSAFWHLLALDELPGACPPTFEAKCYPQRPALCVLGGYTAPACSFYLDIRVPKLSAKFVTTY